MKRNGVLKAALAVAFAASAASAYAIPTISNTDGSFDPFGGFDWSAAGVAFTNNFTGSSLPGQNIFDLYYVSHAVSVNDPFNNAFSTPSLDITATGTRNTPGVPPNTIYEYTVVAKLSERIDSCSGIGAQCSFTVLGGSFEIYYDPSLANAANYANGQGFADGIKIIAGNIFGGTQTTFSSGASGQVDISGEVTFTNTTYINPKLVGTDVSTTLRLSQASGGTKPLIFPASFDMGSTYGNAVGVNTSPGPNGTSVVLQADGNQFFSVPEPSVVLLTGLSLFGVGVTRFRKKG